MNAPRRIVRKWLVVAAMSLVVAPAALALDLVKDGKPCASIVVADDAGAYQKWAAQWLQQYVNKATGATLPIVPEANKPAGTLISVGHTRLAAEAGLKTDDLEYDGCKLAVKANTLFLIGRDDAPLYDKSPSPRQSGAQGTIRAVAQFLEDVAGVRWFIPTPEGVVVPKTRDLIAPDAFNKTFSPVFAYADTGYAPEYLACYANNHRVAMKLRSYGGHSWGSDVPVATHFKDHPEYYRVDEAGKRNPGAATNPMLCTSDPGVRRVIVQAVQKHFDSGYDAVQLNASDGWQPCYCPGCEKLRAGRKADSYSRATPCQELWDMNLWIINELRKTHPQKKVVVLLYGPTRWPPRGLDTLPDNCIAEVAPLVRDVLDAWKGKLPAIASYVYWWDEDTTGTAFVPPLSPQWLQKTLREYRDLNVVGIHGGPSRNWGMGGPTFYACAKLLSDPDASLDKLLDDYCMGVYGAEAAPTMTRFFKLFHSCSGLQPALREAVLWQGKAPSPNPYACLPEFCFTTQYPPAVLTQLDGLLRHAEKRVQGERQREWVKHTRDCFEGFKRVAEMYHAKRAFELDPTRDALLRVKTRVDAVETWRDQIIAYHDKKEYLDRFFPFYWKLCAGLLCEGDRHVYSGSNGLYYSPKRTFDLLAEIASGKKKVRGTPLSPAPPVVDVPLTWDFNRMMAAIGKPKDERAAHVPLASKPPTLDGRINPDEWRQCQPLALERLQAPGSAIPDAATTRVRLMYDAQNLYVAYECREPNLDGLKLKSVGRDGDVWQQDEVELFLNPEPSTRKVAHFMAAPTPDAWYDEFNGRITDELHPDHGRPDIAWNADWKYAFNIDRDKGVWTLVMAVPFKSLDTPAPKPGAAWSANFARARRAGSAEVLTSWASETFGAPDLFGGIIFGGEKGRPVATPAPAPASPAAPKAEDKAPVENGSFEDLDPDGKLIAWTPTTYPGAKKNDALAACCGPSDEKAHTGQRSLRLDFRGLDFDKAPANGQVLVSQVLDAQALAKLKGKTVVLSAWLNYDYVATDAAGHYFPGPLIWVRVSSADGKLASAPGLTIHLNKESLPRYGLGSPTATLGKWVKVEARGAIPAGTARAEMKIEHVALGRDPAKDRNDTAVFIDDVRLDVTDQAAAQ